MPYFKGGGALRYAYKLGMRWSFWNGQSPIKNGNKNDIQDDTPTMGSLQRDGETDDFVVSLQRPTIQIWMDRSVKNIVAPAMPTPRKFGPHSGVLIIIYLDDSLSRPAISWQNWPSPGDPQIFMKGAPLIGWFFWEEQPSPIDVGIHTNRWGSTRISPQEAFFFFSGFFGFQLRCIMSFLLPRRGAGMAGYLEE